MLNRMSSRLSELCPGQVGSGRDADPRQRQLLGPSVLEESPACLLEICRAFIEALFPVLMWIRWSILHSSRLESYKVYVATATNRSPCSCEAQLDPSHGTGAWALQEL